VRVTNPAPNDVYKQVIITITSPAICCANIVGIDNVVSY
jgi:hypothetical protein